MLIFCEYFFPLHMLRLPNFEVQSDSIFSYYLGCIYCPLWNSFPLSSYPYVYSSLRCQRFIPPLFLSCPFSGSQDVHRPAHGLDGV